MGYGSMAKRRRFSELPASVADYEARTKRKRYARPPDTPTRWTFFGCCARATAPHIANATPTAIISTHFGFSILRLRSAQVLDFRLFDHRITLSALTKTFGGIVRPIRFAVLRLITSSNFVGCSSGRSRAEQKVPETFLSFFLPGHMPRDRRSSR